MEDVVQCPLLIHIAAARLWCDARLTSIRHLLNVSWDEVRAATGRLRPTIPVRRHLRDLPDLLICDWMTRHQGTWRSNICSQLAWGIIRVRKLIEIGHLPEEVW
jgi:hypothetical protein